MHINYLKKRCPFHSKGQTWDDIQKYASPPIVFTNSRSQFCETLALKLQWPRRDAFLWCALTHRTQLNWSLSVLVVWRIRASGDTHARRIWPRTNSLSLSRSSLCVAAAGGRAERPSLSSCFTSRLTYNYSSIMCVAPRDCSRAHWRCGLLLKHRMLQFDQCQFRGDAFRVDMAVLLTHAYISQLPYHLATIYSESTIYCQGWSCKFYKTIL